MQAVRINISVSDLTPAQWAWLLKNTEETWQFVDTASTACVTFEAPEPTSLVGMVHRAIPVRAWLGIVEHMKTITEPVYAVPKPSGVSDGA